MSAEVTIPEEIRQRIQQAYRSFLNARGLSPRTGQKQMIADVARALLRQDGTPIAVVEAGTGTGKTIAYLLAAIPVAQALDRKVVVATATVALQSQLCEKDLPELARHTELKVRSVLAKGRGRYVCLSRLAALLELSEENRGRALFEDELAELPSQQETALVAGLADAFVEGRWDGDRDHWPEEIDERLWQRLTTDHRQCSNRKCQHVDGCAFFRARDELDEADCIVANHDLVLADLALGGGAILPPPEETIYIFDEGHHLANKALQHFSHQLRLEGASQWQRRLEKSLARLGERFASNAAVAALLQGPGEAARVLSEIWPQFRDTVRSVVPEREEGADEGRYLLFPGGQLPEALSDGARQCALPLKKILSELELLAVRFSDAMGDSSLGINRAEAERWYGRVGELLGQGERMLGLLEDYAANRCDPASPQARWISRLTGQSEDLMLCASPILAGQTLSVSLWERCAGAVVTSATLTALGSFDHFREASGVPADALFRKLDSPFDYAAVATLRVPELGVDPKDTAAHDHAVAEALKKMLKPDQGALVLFTSWRQLNAVHALLDDEMKGRILRQGELSRQQMLVRHRQAIDEGQGSCIFGLASFAEGVDLPGAYLTQVVIARIPFSVPDDPIEKALQDWVQARGGNPFQEVSVPKASLRLVQACGRLIRTEQDHGEVIILDPRLRQKNYGRDLLKALPPFRRTF